MHSLHKIFPSSFGNLFCSQQEAHDLRLPGSYTKVKPVDMRPCRELWVLTRLFTVTSIGRMYLEHTGGRTFFLLVSMRNQCYPKSNVRDSSSRLCWHITLHHKYRLTQLNLFYGSMRRSRWKWNTGMKTRLNKKTASSLIQETWFEVIWEELLLVTTSAAYECSTKPFNSLFL